MNEKPEEKPAPEVRGGHTYADFADSIPVAHEDSELEDGAESYGDSEIESSE